MKTCELADMRDIGIGKTDYSNTDIESDVSVGDVFTWSFDGETNTATVIKIRQYADGKTFTVRLGQGKAIKGYTINDLLRCGYRPA